MGTQADGSTRADHDRSGNDDPLRHVTSADTVDERRIADLEAQGRTDRADIADLRTQAVVDRGNIDDLEAQAAIDQRIIEELTAQAVVDRHEITHLGVALTSSRRIGAAVGVIMSALKVSEPAAFEVLVKASQDSNRKLRDLSDDIILTGAVPTRR